MPHGGDAGGWRGGFGGCRGGWRDGGSQMEGPENSSSSCSKEEETVSHQPLAFSVQKSCRETANGTSDHGRVTLGAKRRGWDARSEGCGERGEIISPPLYSLRKEGWGSRSGRAARAVG